MRRTSLRGLRQPEPVALRGWIAGGNRLLSPVTGQAAALIHWQLVARDGLEAHGRLFEQGFFGDVLLFATPDGAVQVPSRHLRAYFAAGGPIAQPLPSPLPPAIGALAPSAEACALAARGVLFYREHELLAGRPARLRAVVAPREIAGGYRVAADAAFVACDQLEAPVVSVDVAEMA